MKEIKAWECDFCGHVTPRTEEGAKQHEEECRWKKEGHDVWIQDGKVCHSPKLPPELFGPHDYALHDGTSDCRHSCGCWVGPYRSGGSVNPFGPCPRNPKAQEKKEVSPRTHTKECAYRSDCHNGLDNPRNCNCGLW